MKRFLPAALAGFIAFAAIHPASAQTIQTIGTDPLTGQVYACAAYNPKSKNNIVVTNKAGKKKTLKISVAAANISEHLADAKQRVREVTKLKREKEKARDKIEGSLFGPLQVAKYNKLNEAIKKLELKLIDLNSQVALLTQLKKLIKDCKEAVPFSTHVNLVSGIFPPGVPGAGYYYAFIVYVFSPNVASHYCATIESPNQTPGGDRGLFKVSSNVCAKYNLPECFDVTRDAGLLLYTKLGPNRPTTCKTPEDVCDLTSAIADANRYLAAFKFYDIKPTESTDPGICDTL